MMDAITVLGMLAVVCGMLWAFQSEKTVLGMLAVVCGMLWAFQSEKLRLGRHEG